MKSDLVMPSHIAANGSSGMLDFGANEPALILRSMLVTESNKWKPSEQRLVITTKRLIADFSRLLKNVFRGVLTCSRSAQNAD